MKTCFLVFLIFNLLYSCKKDISPVSNTIFINSNPKDYYEDNFFTIDGETVYMLKKKSMSDLPNLTSCTGSGFSWINESSINLNSLIFVQTISGKDTIGFIGIRHTKNGTIINYQILPNQISKLKIQNGMGEFKNVNFINAADRNDVKIGSGKITCTK